MRQRAVVVVVVAGLVSVLPEPLAGAEKPPGASAVPVIEAALAARVAAAKRADTPHGLVRVHVALERGRGTPELRTKLAATGASVVAFDAPAVGPHAALVDLDLAHAAETLGRLASVPHVLHLSEVVELRPQSDETCWQVQTGIDTPGASDLDVTAKLFAHGVTGRGVIIGSADAGIENDACALTYAHAIDEAAWRMGPGCMSADPVPQEGASLDAVRTRGRKVVAYYLLDGAVPFGSTGHGTVLATLMAGDRREVLAARPLVRDAGIRQNLPGWAAGSPWAVGQSLRDDLAALVDDPRADEFALANPHGTLIEHHQSGDGIAPGAQLVTQEILNDDGCGTAGPLTARALLDQAFATGVTAYDWSLGSAAAPVADGYWGYAPDVDDATWRLRTLVVAASAGNDGHEYTPAGRGVGTVRGGFSDAKNALVAGAAEAPDSPSEPVAVRPGEDLFEFSSRGPRTGDRLAPTLVAAGEVRVRDPGHPNPEDGTGSGDGWCGGSLASHVGTSFSAGVTTASAALVQQYFLDGYYPSGEPVPADALRPTNALVGAILVNSARNVRGAHRDDPVLGRADRPNHAQGWGMPRLDDTLYFSGDPTDDDARGDSERASLVVLNDVPNGYDGTFPPSPEPGGRTRADIVAGFQPALADGEIHDYFVEVLNADPGSSVNELRVTLAWSDPAAPSGSLDPLVNDLDLEVIGPGPDGVLQSTGDQLLGDDVVYRPAITTSWQGGFTVPSPERAIQSAAALVDFADRDRVETLENVFVPPSRVHEGTWRIRVIGHDVPGSGLTSVAHPDFATGDRPPVLDVDGDGTPDREVDDLIASNRQGYALIVSGNVSTAQLGARGRLELGPRSMGCACGDVLRVRLIDDGLACVVPGSCDPDGDGTPMPPVLTARLTTVAAGGLGVDVEDVTLDGSLPVHDGQIAVLVTSDPADVVPGNGRVELAPGASVTAVHVEQSPCGAIARATSRVTCRPLALRGPVTATVEGECRIAVAWQAATGGDGVITYDVFRDALAPVALDDAHRVAAGLSGTSWLDATAPGLVPWAYRVVASSGCLRAANDGGDSARVETPDAAPPIFAGVEQARVTGGCGEVELSWDESTAFDACGIAGFNVYRDPASMPRGRTRVASLVPGSPWQDAPGAGRWAYVVRAVDHTGREDANAVVRVADVSAVSQPPRDALMDAVDGPSRQGDDLRLRWKPSPDEGGSCPLTYAVVRGDLAALRPLGYTHALARPDACRLTARELTLASEMDGLDAYYIVAPVRGDLANFGADSAGRARPPAPACP